jgi:putative methionine-R-sulfoxide reductase with GAF domain
MLARGVSYRHGCGLLRDVSRRQARSVADVAFDITASGWSARAFPRARRRIGVVATTRAGEDPSRAVPGRLSDVLREASDLRDILGAVTDVAAAIVPGCHTAGITVIHDGVPATVVAFDARARSVDETQYRQGYGPCLQAARSRAVVQIDDLTQHEDLIPSEDAARQARTRMAHGAKGDLIGQVAQLDIDSGAKNETRGWALIALEAGLHAVLSVPIPAGPDLLASLNLYAARGTGWPGDALAAAETLARYAGEAIAVAHTMASDLCPPPAHPAAPAARHLQPAKSLLPTPPLD